VERVARHGFPSLFIAGWYYRGFTPELPCFDLDELPDLRTKLPLLTFRNKS
jgi:hypothetical protein